MYTEHDEVESLTPATPATPKVSYGLEGIVLHNSFDRIKGRTIRIDCRGRTHIGGANGAGKTSTLSLIPIFFGEEPERVVTRNSGRLSFVDYYLPNQQSLIIFEYRRYSGLCCAVLFRHHTGKLCYRFVEGSAADTFFAPETVELLKAGATNQEVFDQLRSKGVTVSNMVDTITDYRAIIQNNPKLLRRHPAETRRLRALAADFSLGDRDTQMSHIDRLTHVVLNRSRLLSSFKTMICETQFENIHLQSRPKPIDEQGLVQDIKSLKAFDKEEASIRACLKQEAERQGIADSARVTAGNLVAAIEESREQRSQWLEAAGRIRQEIQGMEDEFSDSDSQRTRKIEEKTHARNVRKEDLDDIYNCRDEYEEKGAPELSQDFDNLPEYQRKYEDAQTDSERVTGQVRQLQGEHEREVERVQHKFDREQEKRKSKVQEADKALTQASHTYEKELIGIDSSRNERERELEKTRSSERTNLSNHLTRAETLRDNTGQTPEESQRIKDAEISVRKAEDEVLKVERELGEERDKREQARQDRDTAQVTFEKAQDHLGGLREQADKLKKQLSPDNGTWLSQLRQIDPAWGERLAKVINPELLDRTDLNPQKVACDQPDLVMGWSLALEGLPVPDFAASEEELQARLREVDDRIEEAIKQKNQAEKYAQSRNATYADRQRAVEHKETEKTLADQLLERSREHLTTARSDIDEAIAQRKKVLEQEVELIQEQIDEFDTQTEAMLKELADDFSRQTVERKGRWADEQAELEGQLTNAQELAQEAKKEHTARLETMEKAYLQRLQDNDIDPTVVQQLRKARDEAEGRVKQIKENEPLVREYRDWLKKQWSRVKALTEVTDNLSAELSTLQREQEALREKHQAAMKQRADEAKQLEDKARRLGVQVEQADNTIRQFKAMGEKPASNGFPGTLSTLIQDLQDDCSRLEKLRGEVLRAFSRAQGVLNTYSGTQIYQSWQKHLQYRRGTLSDPGMEFDDSFKLTLVQDLRLLLDTDVPHLRSAVIEQFAAHAGNLKDYFDSLETMAREVKRVSNQLRRRINTDQQIESISDIRVELQARIEDDDSWQPLKAFVDQWDDWHALHPREIPSDQIIAAFQRVTDTLKSASVGQSIESMIDMKLVMKENGRDVPIRNDNDFLNASSEGLTYLAIMAVFIGMTRYLCPDLNVRITWPVDEIGKLDPNNISRLASMLEHNNLTMISACPELNRPLRKFFENKISIKDGRVHNFEAAVTTGDHGTLLADLVKPRARTNEEEAPNVG